jgi:hypothetical protein
MGKTLRSWWVRASAAGLAAAAAFVAGRLTQPPTAHAGPGDAPSDFGQRLVATMYNGRLTISREDLGEYLIARHGAEKIDLLVNKTIIDAACKERGIEVSAAEVEAAFLDDLKGINVNRQQFVDTVLKQYGLTLFEWKEDKLRPLVQLRKLCKLDITVTEDEIKQAFEAEFGTRLEGRIVIWPKGQERFAQIAYDKLRGSEEEFDNAARGQAISSLAASGGRIKPFGRGAGTHPSLEAEAFKLKPGQVSTLVGTGEGTVCFKLDKILPPEEGVKLDEHRERLNQVVFDKKLTKEIPRQVKVLRDAARPVVLLKRADSPDNLDHASKTLMPDLQQTGAKQKP